ncbi:type III effector [Apibacter muscae]|uniref:HopJ type III effector protein n=1 Tax=Apibacter muscae TaxID=2509004 RepID=UPI0011AC2D7B|nr:HopJ type III effector protein [Apibacter muscae]TWP30853.1 type III effector [Apibacter muscae]
MILEQLKNAPESIEFNEVIAYIDNHYNFTPTSFKNGDINNESGQNNGSCKVFSFAKLHQVSKEKTLFLFGKFYREDVLKNPEGTDHANIRNFMKYGWEGMGFKDQALKKKVA